MTSVTTLSPHKTAFSKTANTFLDSFTEPDNGPGMREESARLETFNGWPCTFLSPRNLAKAGFYYTRKDDVVKCAFCRVEIGKWNQDDEPVAEHKKWSPQCVFIRDSSTVGTNSTGEDTCGKYGIEIRPNSVAENEPCCSSALKPSSLQKLGIQQNRGPAYPNYAVYESRLKSFAEWPRSMKQKPVDLASAGFFYTGKGDQTLCFHCGGGLKDWEDDDDPWEQHALWFSRCNFLILQKSKDFVREVFKKKKEEVPESSNSESSNSEVTSETNKKVKVEEKKEDEEEKKSETNSSTLCKICYSKEVGVVFLPCGHVVACVDCAPALSTCAVCRKPLEATVRAFLS